MTPQRILAKTTRILAICLIIREACGAIPSQEPEIVPSGGKFEGAVQGGVALLSNADRSVTKLYYTVSRCCDCPDWKRPDPKNAGIDKDTRELKRIGERIHLTTTSCVSSLAVTQDQEPSDIVKALFQITASLVTPPIISPKRGKYRGKVVLTMSAQDGCEIYYTINGAEPSKQSEKYHGPITINTFGKHYIRAVSISGGVTSPITVHEVEIVLPVRYMVVTDGCDTCKGPTVGRPFTVMFQGFKPTPVTRVFISPVECSPRGAYHMLEGCDCRDGVVPANLTLKMITNDAPAAKVYICFSENGGLAWTTLLNAATAEPFFPLFPPLSANGSHVDPTSLHNAQQDGGMVEEATPKDWEDYHKAEKRKKARVANSNTDVLTPGIVVLVILGTGLWFAFRRA
eukprot:TRINITY_DN9702_c0_g1_i1.p1 TRINITY_DN9702_c0_g1~~TRINITY_DN9702_c0_g1_i1.p1  ORF type:complete len:417 (+),score=35.57 TRINITY_DN9702_c0_g1_i1:53-1252(+)